MKLFGSDDILYESLYYSLKLINLRRKFETDITFQEFTRENKIWLCKDKSYDLDFIINIKTCYKEISMCTHAAFMIFYGF